MKVLYLTPWYPSSDDAMSGLFVQKHVEAVRAQGVDVRVIDSQGWFDMWRQWRELNREGWKPDVVQLNVLQKQGLLALHLKRRYGIPYIIVEHWSGYLPENGAFMGFPGIKRRMLGRVACEAECVLTVSARLEEAMRTCGIKAKRWGLIDNVVEREGCEERDTFVTLQGNGSPANMLLRPPTQKNDPKRVNCIASEEERTNCIASEGERELTSEGVNELTNEGVKGERMVVHVSCFDEKAKNVKALLRAWKELTSERVNGLTNERMNELTNERVKGVEDTGEGVRLVMIGDGVDYQEVRAYAEEIGIDPRTILWTGEIENAEVHRWLERADVFVLTSRYETYGVVLAEALNAGVPIVSTDVGIAPEIIDEKTGVLLSQAEANDTHTLAEKIREALEIKKYKYSGRRFEAKEIGAQLIKIYDSCMHHDI